MLYNYNKLTRDFLGRFYFLLSLFLYFLEFGGIFNKTMIPVALVGYKMIIANSALRTSSAISHPTPACGIIIN